uniref:Uncharacterized protein n=1 Tax=Romanomermis culicivorax TaxID=13658 RepID=A0A915HRE3_ROMCU
MHDIRNAACACRPISGLEIAGYAQKSEVHEVDLDINRLRARNSKYQSVEKTHARISSQVDAISYEDTCPVDYPPGGIFYTISKNLDEKSLPMDELEMKKHGLVDSHCEHRPFQGEDNDAKLATVILTRQFLITTGFASVA